MYRAKVIIELIELGNTSDEAVKNVNAFLDWCDEASSSQGFTYETTDYEITIDVNKASEWTDDHVQEEE